MAERFEVADYAPSARPGSRGGLIAKVDEGSPAWEAGLRAGMVLTEANGLVLRDLIDWYWVSDDLEVTVSGFVPVGLLGDDAGDDEPFEFDCDLERAVGQSWGIEFADAIFDDMHLCVNDCLFCFMSMLPEGMRDTLYLRDDDYRLSFLQGNFVTLTNVGEDDLDRILDQRISPLHVSVHAVDPVVRRRLIGENEARGMEVLERLLEAGIDCHAQIVLVPDINDGKVLEETLSWLEGHHHVLSCSIVPLGYTRFQTRFDASFRDPVRALEVIELVSPFQERARRDRDITRFHLADEFYLNAQIPLPLAEEYDGFGQYEDGIGMVRSFLEEWDAFWRAHSASADERVKRAMTSGRHAHLFTGEAFGPTLIRCFEHCPIADRVSVHVVRNDFFGGDVDVTGLLCGCDVSRAIAGAVHVPGAEEQVFIPDAMFNADGVTLDDYAKEDIERESGRSVDVLSCSAEDMLDGIVAFLSQDR